MTFSNHEVICGLDKSCVRLDMGWMPGWDEFIGNGREVNWRKQVQATVSMNLAAKMSKKTEQ